MRAKAAPATIFTGEAAWKMDFGRLFRILIPALMIYALANMFVTGAQLEKARGNLALAQEQAKALEEENGALELLLSRADDPEFMEQLARQRLGLVMPEDKVFYGPGN